MKKIGIVGYRGHFGKIISEVLINTFPEIQFILLGRRKPAALSSNASFSPFDFHSDQTLPAIAADSILILDLTGPVKQDDGRLFAICARANIPYMDMAIHNSHINTINEIRRRYPDSTALVHFGFFPGVSNLMIAEGFKQTGRKEAVLISEFPVYAGGGKNVSTSLANILDESRSQFNLIQGKKHSFIMHSESRSFPWKGTEKRFYRWQYPEIDSILHSYPDAVSIERFFSIKPALLNPVFKTMIQLWNAKFFRFLKPVLINSVYFSKSTLFSRNDPALIMKLFDGNQRELVTLSVKSAVSFHGLVMAKFLSGLLERKLAPGLYTPEQIFSLAEIWKAGEYDTHILKYSQK